MLAALDFWDEMSEEGANLYREGADFFTLEYLTNGVSCNKIEICRKILEKQTQ